MVGTGSGARVGPLVQIQPFYGRAGIRLVAYDNEPGKGDHWHYEEVEESYQFTTPEQLIRDFLADVRRLRQQRRSGER